MKTGRGVGASTALGKGLCELWGLKNNIFVSRQCDFKVTVVKKYGKNGERGFD